MSRVSGTRSDWPKRIPHSIGNKHSPRLIGTTGDVKDRAERARWEKSREVNGVANDTTTVSMASPRRLDYFLSNTLSRVLRLSEEII